MKRGVDKVKKHNSNVFAYIVRALLIIFIVAILYNLFLLAFSAKTDKEAKYVFGFRAYVITTDSMKPNLRVGDIVIIQKTENDDLSVNDVITYRLSNDLERITHRVVDKSTDIYVTKGDNNKLEDKNIVRYENIEGKVIFKIPFIGKVFLKVENVLYVIFLSIIILTIYLYQRRLMNKSEIRRAKKRYADSLRKEAKDEKNLRNDMEKEVDETQKKELEKESKKEINTEKKIRIKEERKESNTENNTNQEKEN